MRRPEVRLTGNSVALAGAVLGLLSLPFGWLTLKPNRIVAGTALRLHDSFGWGGTILLVCLWVICLVLALSKRNRWSAVLLGIAASSIIITTFLLAGQSATRLLQGQTESTRVSLGAGIWVTLAGVYMVIFAVRDSLKKEAVWRFIIYWCGPAVVVILLAGGWLNHLSIMQEYLGNQQRFMQELIKHATLFLSSVAIGAVIGISLGVWAARSSRAEKPIFYISNITQTIPSLALFGLLMAPLSALSFAHPTLRELGIRGVGVTPAMIALVIYSLLPIVRNTFVSLRQLDPAIIDAGRGMGMSRSQIFRKIEMPLAAPLVLEGVRTASVQSVGLVTVAALIGAGGLGWFIFRGIGQTAPDLILVGAIPILVMALVVDAIMRAIVRLATPKGIKTVEQ